MHSELSRSGAPSEKSQGSESRELLEHEARSESKQSEPPRRDYPRTRHALSDESDSDLTPWEGGTHLDFPLAKVNSSSESDSDSSAPEDEPARKGPKKKQPTKKGPIKEGADTQVHKRGRKQAFQLMVDKELRRIEDASSALREQEAYKCLSPAGQEQLENDIENESGVVLNNLLWLLKKENGLSHLGVSLEVTLEEHIGSGDEEVKLELSHTREPLGDKFIPTAGLQGYFPDLVEEAKERYRAFGYTDNDSIVKDNILDSRHDLAKNPPTYTFTDIRKKLGLHERPGSQKRELDRTWKMFRREVRDEIAITNLREIRKATEPERLHSETLRIARKILSQQDCWKDISVTQKKLEDLAYGLVIREYNISNEKSAGFGDDGDQLEGLGKRPGGDQKRTLAEVTPAVMKSPLKRRRTSVKNEVPRADFLDDSSDSTYGTNTHRQQKKKLRTIATRSSTAIKTKSPLAYVTHLSRLAPDVSGNHSASRRNLVQQDIPLAQRKELVEIKRMELEAEKMLLAISEKRDAYRKQYALRL